MLHIYIYIYFILCAIFHYVELQTEIAIETQLVFLIYFPLLLFWNFLYHRIKKLILLCYMSFSCQCYIICHLPVNVQCNHSSTVTCVLFVPWLSISYFYAVNILFVVSSVLLTRLLCHYLSFSQIVLYVPPICATCHYHYSLPMITPSLLPHLLTPSCYIYIQCRPILYLALQNTSG